MGIPGAGRAPLTSRRRGGGGGGGLDHLLLDGAEDRGAHVVAHLDAHTVAEAHEGGLGGAPVQGLDRAHLGQARGARGTGAVGDRARADDGPGRERAGPRAAWAMSVGKSKVISMPASGRPTRRPFRWLTSGRCTLPPSDTKER